MTTAAAVTRSPQAVWRPNQHDGNHQQHCLPHQYVDLGSTSMHEGAIYWYEEETIVDEAEPAGSDEEYTEVTYESECPTEDDILLGTLPPAPPLAECGDMMQVDAASEQKLLEAMRRKRDEESRKTTIPGTQRGQPLPKQKLPPQPGRSSKPALRHQHSPTGIWEHPTIQVTPNEKPKTPPPSTPFKTYPRLKKVDEILLQHDLRRAFFLHSADPRQQTVSLQKFWRERIDYQMEFIHRQLLSMEEDMARTAKNLAAVKLEDVQIL